MGDGLYQRSGLLAIDVESDNSVDALFTHDGEEAQVVDGYVDRVSTVAVHNGGNVAGAAGTTSGALAELGTGGGGESLLCHSNVLL